MAYFTLCVQFSVGARLACLGYCAAVLTCCAGGPVHSHDVVHREGPVICKFSSKLIQQIYIALIWNPRVLFFWFCLPIYLAAVAQSSSLSVCQYLCETSVRYFHSWVALLVQYARQLQIMCALSTSIRNSMQHWGAIVIWEILQRIHLLYTLVCLIPSLHTGQICLSSQ